MRSERAWSNVDVASTSDGRKSGLESCARAGRGSSELNIDDGSLALALFATRSKRRAGTP